MSTLFDKLIGTWGLVSYESETQDGTINYPFGENPLGTIIYAADGYVSVQLMRTGRYGYINSELFDDLGVKYADLPYIAYSGPFSIDEAKTAVTHNVEVGLDPDWIGQQQYRLIELKDNFLKLSSDGPVGPGKTWFRLLWKRK